MICRNCCIDKIISSFEPNRRICKGCRNISKRARYSFVKEKENEKSRVWRSKNKSKVAQFNAIWKKENYTRYLELHRYHASKYRATKLRRTPNWSNPRLVKEIYYNCPSGFHVDHIVPLQGTNVSGLHVENNLQYLPAKINMRKKNNWEIL